MSAPIDPTGFGAKEWITVVGHSVSYLLDNGDTIWIIANDAEYPSGWQIQLHAVGAPAVVLGDEWFPVKAGALEWARGYMRKAGRHTVPTELQRSRGWFEHSDIAKAERKAEAERVDADRKAKLAAQAAAEAEQNKPTTYVVPESPVAYPAGTNVNIDVTVSLDIETQRAIDRVNAAMRGENLYSCSRGHSGNQYSSATGVCPECGSIGKVI